MCIWLALCWALFVATCCIEPLKKAVFASFDAINCKKDGCIEIGHVSLDGPNDGFGHAVVRYIVGGSESGKTIIQGVSALGGCDDTRSKATLIHGLDERAEVDVSLFGIRLAFPIVHVTCVDAGTREQVQDVHQGLFCHVGYSCVNGNFLAVGATLEQELGWILWVVGGNESQSVLAPGIGSWLTVHQHELFKNLI
jgi:hypothetical protein